MAMTLSQKILASHAGKETAKAGEFVFADVDLVMGNDITAPVAIEEFGKLGAKKVFDAQKIALIPDHFTPCKDIKSAEQVKILRNFAKKHSIRHFYEMGRAGIEHALIPELGLALPGELVIGADSHTCTYGALSAFSTGVGSTDMAVAMATGKAWFRVPEAVKIEITGKLGKFVSGKDVILEIIGQIGVEGARYMSMEFAGEGISELSMDDRLCISNMAIEAGGKNGIFESDDMTIKYIDSANKENRPYKSHKADEGAIYAKTLKIDLNGLDCVVAFPHLPENKKYISEIKPGEIKIDQAVIGSCTNGRLSDLRVAAKILRGKKVGKNVRCIIIPATQKIWKEAMAEGLLEIFVDSGCVVSTPTCGPCLGGHMGILASGEKAVATTNRNFVGRMGHPESEVYLSNPAVAAASAIMGYIADAGEV
ncbi:MAG: 3-isopropylmalate dehydratase large subunit [Oscillospiraceae bacterium]|nr:3-isopropylmalate dehydratase large subunit [Oscillospiraceae bacterium]